MQSTQNPLSTADEPSVADTLRHAALYLQRHGWTEDQFYADSGIPAHLRQPGYPPADILGALLIAITGHRVDHPTDLRGENPSAWNLYQRCINALADWIDHNADLWHDHTPAHDATHRVCCFNDQPGQEPAEIVEALHHTAADLDGTNYQVNIFRYLAVHLATLPGPGGTR